MWNKRKAHTNTYEQKNWMYVSWGVWDKVAVCKIKKQIHSVLSTCQPTHCSSQQANTAKHRSGQCCIDYLKCNKHRRSVTARKCTRNGNIVGSLVHPTFDIMLLAFVSFGCYESNREKTKNIVLQQKFPFFSCILSFFILELPAIILAQRHWGHLFSQCCAAFQCMLRNKLRARTHERVQATWAIFHPFRLCHSLLLVEWFIQAVSSSSLLWSSYLPLLRFSIFYIFIRCGSHCVVCRTTQKEKTKYMPNCPAFSFPQSFKYANTKIQNYILCGCRCCLLNTYIDDIALCASSFW